ncbi:hypothetical protein PAPYR_4180 [Paratrimastix pyriformis]|uniref:Uncharacterized protein n=1 Tax=Paratrimastix pyriformis TaxID=342808 RepID=A0ABQ8UNA8_9EUKA|nr:hypothetical protein PAPYR_4180 [Paratrimastix pyriformis]
MVSLLPSPGTTLGALQPSTNEVSIVLADDGAKVFINGVPVAPGAPTRLGQGDRVVVGRHLVFRFVNPALPPSHLSPLGWRVLVLGVCSPVMDPEAEWELVTKELAVARGHISSLEEYDGAFRQNAAAFHCDDLVDEANEIARALGDALQAHYLFATDLDEQKVPALSMSRGVECDGGVATSMSAVTYVGAEEGCVVIEPWAHPTVRSPSSCPPQNPAVVAISLDDGISSRWSVAQLEARMEGMREMLRDFQEDGDIDWYPEENPFFEQPQDQLVGSGTLPLAPLLQSVQPCEQVVSLVTPGPHPVRIADLRVKVALRINGAPPSGPAQLTPAALLGQAVDVISEFQFLTRIPTSLSGGVYIGYQLFPGRDDKTARLMDPAVALEQHVFADPFEFRPFTEEVFNHWAHEGSMIINVRPPLTSPPLPPPPLAVLARWSPFVLPRSLAKPASSSLHHPACITQPASPSLHHPACITQPASPSLHHPACIILTLLFDRPLAIRAR